MHVQVSSSETFCTFAFFDCFTNKEESSRGLNVTGNHTSLRQTTVHYQQPHLVEPMKLTVYENLPTTPLSATPSRPFFSRATTGSRISSRASLFSLRQRTPKPSPLISDPTRYQSPSNDLPLRRRREFRPLELSIYVDRHRLSDLPEFDRFSFTEFGELKNLAQVLSRPQSAVLPPLQYTPLLAMQETPKATSMYEMSATKVTRPQTSCSVTSVSRPPSEYDALHSHPVSWASLPGLSIVTHSQKSEKPVAVLTPMEEEFPPESPEVTVAGTALAFPKDAYRRHTIITNNTSLPVDLAAPAPVISRGSYHGSQGSQSMDNLVPVATYEGRPKQRQSIGQWLAERKRSGSTSTVATDGTTTSFAEHRRKRSEFYQLGQQTQVAEHVRPQSLGLIQDSATIPFHRRTVTGSTIASTVDTDILSLDDQGRNSEDTWTTASDLRSRSGTIKSIPSPGGRKVVTSTINEIGLLPPMRGQVYVVDEETPYLDEIRGRLRTPGIGVAF